MEIVTMDDKARSLPQYSAPAPSMHRNPPSEPPHPLSRHPGLFAQPWRQYPPSYDAHQPPDPRRVSNAPQPPLSANSYNPSMPGRELPQLPTDGHYGRTASLPAPAHAPAEAPPQPTNIPPMNGVLHESSPMAATPDFARARMSFGPQDQPLPNGEPPALPPQSLPPPQYTPAVPSVSHTPAPYEHPSYYQSQSYGMRQQRRATRAQQACDQCRTRKAKCDEGRPSCSHCKDNQLTCVYKEVPPHKQEKAMQAVLDRMQLMEDQVAVRFQDLAQLHVHIDRRLDQLWGLLAGKAQPDMPQMWQFPSTRMDAAEPFRQPWARAPTVVNGLNSQAPPQYQGVMIEPGEDGPLSIPLQHTTAAHKLLGWPSIIKLLAPHRYDEDYVLKLEQYRGLIKTDGRGMDTEGFKELFPQPSSSDSRRMEGVYPHTASPSRAFNSPTKYNEAPLEVRGIDETGLVSIDGDTVRRYRDSYLKHMHRLHPFLDEEELCTKIDQFIELYCPSPFRLNARNSAGTPRGAKRKRSSETLGEPDYVQAQDGTGPQKVEKTIINAIICLVLALGRICEVRDVPIRGPCTDQVIDYRNEPIPGSSPRPTVSPAGPYAMPPPQAGSYLPYPACSPATGPTIDDEFTILPDPPHLENVDTVPGLAFYGFAANILGPRHGATDLEYAQACLLAGLYAGQLANPLQSASWLAQAGRACQVLTLPKYYNEYKPSKEKDLIEFAYWTCSQLEGDILAELDLPASGISHSEGRIKLPDGPYVMTLPDDTSDPNTIVLFYYMAQIHLRKVLNKVHSDLYKVKRNGETTRWSSQVVSALNMNLDLWRYSLPEEMKWQDNDPPSPDILEARMRAKYYGAKYIIHRPLLYHALHYTGPNINTISGSQTQEVSPSLTHGQHAPDMGLIASDLGAVQEAIGLTAHSYRDLPQALRTKCKICVDAAIKSTEVFDAIEGRPVVTNIFGTAHAQFGNMLVLSTTYMSHLSELVKREDLERLLRRTIAFLLRNKNISPTLRADAKILADIYEKIFGEPPTITTMYG
ncbi:hypothetical protein BJX61DRAFT_534176 [Aspergillus egyptiacus]|nr:hypothetical protein BJX61DRAFT_534176 [Aspergillus egyptiacus]